MYVEMEFNKKLTHNVDIQKGSSITSPSLVFLVKVFALI